MLLIQWVSVTGTVGEWVSVTETVGEWVSITDTFAEYYCLECLLCCR